MDGDVRMEIRDPQNLPQVSVDLLLVIAPARRGEVRSHDELLVQLQFARSSSLPGGWSA